MGQHARGCRYRFPGQPQVWFLGQEQHLADRAALLE